MDDSIFEYLQDKQKVSISTIQRDLAIGFIKARELYDELVEKGYVYKNGEVNTWAVYDELYKSPNKVDTKDVSEEEIYYARILDLIDNSPFYPTEPESRDRLATELEIIHKEKVSKTIWYCYEVGKFARDHKEPFHLGGTLTNLYTLYVLDVLKYNPIEMGCNYQTCFGPKEKPKYSLSVDVYTSRSAFKLFKEGIKEFEENDAVYQFGVTQSGNKLICDQNEFLVVPKSIDIEKYYCVKRKPDVDGPILVWTLGKDTKDIEIFFRLFPSNILSMYKIMSSIYPTKKFITDDELIEDFEYLLDNKKFETNDLALKTYEMMKKPFDLNDIISFRGYLDSTHAINKTSSIVFPDRDVLFDYLIKRDGFDESLACSLIFLVRTGRMAKRDYYDHECLIHNIDNLLPIEVLRDMTNTLYLTIRGMSAEKTYYYLLLMHYYRYHEKEFLSILQEIGGVSLC